MSLGILVFGDNHFILRGPEPTLDDARAMVRHWSVIQLGQPCGTVFGRWQISTGEFRENLAWAVAAPGDGEQTPAVRQLLLEMAARGIPLREA